MFRTPRFTVLAVVISLAWIGTSGDAALAVDKKPAAKPTAKPTAPTRLHAPEKAREAQRHDSRGSSHADRDRGHDRDEHSDRGRHDDRDRDDDRDHDRGHHGGSHHDRDSHRYDRGHDSHHGHSWGHSSHRRPCGHIGSCPTRSVQVCIRAGYYENRYVPAVTQVCYDSCHRPYTRVICAAHWIKVWVPAVYETRHVSTCETHLSGWNFSFGS